MDSKDLEQARKEAEAYSAYSCERGRLAGWVIAILDELDVADKAWQKLNDERSKVRSECLRSQEQALKFYTTNEDRLKKADALAEAVEEVGIPNLKALGQGQWGPDWDADIFVPINILNAALMAYRSSV